MAREKKEGVKEPEAEPATREELVALAESMNSVLQLDPPITITKKMKEEDIEATIIEQATGNIYEIDFTPDENDDTVPFFSDEDAAILELLGVEILPGAPETAEEEPAPAPAKGKGKETAAPAKKDDKKKADKAPAKKKEDTGPKYTRYRAFADVVKAGKKLSLDDIDQKSDDLYVKNGGNANVEQAGRINDRCVQVLLALELGVKDDKNFTYTNK